MDNCSWCGEPVGHIHVAIIVGGVEKKFHSSLIKDCANAYNKWRISGEVEPYVQHLHLVGGYYAKDKPEHRNGLKGARRDHRICYRVPHPHR